MTAKNHHIVIIGAGFAGLMAAIRLSRKRHQHAMTITLINGSDDYIVRPRLHEWATNQARERQKITDMLDGTDVNFIRAWVSEIQAEHNAVMIANEDGQTSILYDSLIIASGSRVDTQAVKGISDYAYVLDAHEERGAEQLRKKLLGYQTREGHIIVIGGGATGIEGASHIKSLNPHLNVTIVTQGALAAFKNDSRVENGIQASFKEQNIQVRDNVSVDEVQASQIVLKNGETIPFDVCLWAGGFVASPLGHDAGLAVNSQNQILIDPYQRALEYPNIIAVGDCAFPVEEPGNPYRMCCPVAMTMGAHAADNIIRMLSGKEEEPLSFDYYGQGIQLGINDAIGWLAYPDDKVHLSVTRGKPALMIRSAILAGIDVVFDYEKRYGFFTWLGKNRYAKNQKKTENSEQKLSKQSV